MLVAKLTLDFGIELIIRESLFREPPTVIHATIPSPPLSAFTITTSGDLLAPDILLFLFA